MGDTVVVWAGAKKLHERRGHAGHRPLPFRVSAIGLIRLSLSGKLCGVCFDHRLGVYPEDRRWDSDERMGKIFMGPLEGR